MGFQKGGVRKMSKNVNKEDQEVIVGRFQMLLDCAKNNDIAGVRHQISGIARRILDDKFIDILEEKVIINKEKVNKEKEQLEQLIKAQKAPWMKWEE